MDTTLYILTMVDANPADGFVRFLYLIILHLSTFPVSQPEMIGGEGHGGLGARSLGLWRGRYAQASLLTNHNGQLATTSRMGHNSKLTAKEVQSTRAQWPKAISDLTPLHPSYPPIAPQIDR